MDWPQYKPTPLTEELFGGLMKLAMERERRRSSTPQDIVISPNAIQQWIDEGVICEDCHKMLPDPFEGRGLCDACKR